MTRLLIHRLHRVLERSKLAFSCTGPQTLVTCFIISFHTLLLVGKYVYRRVLHKSLNLSAQEAYRSADERSRNVQGEDKRMSINQVRFYITY